MIMNRLFFVCFTVFSNFLCFLDLEFWYSQSNGLQSVKVVSVFFVFSVMLSFSSKTSVRHFGSSATLRVGLVHASDV